MFGFYYSKDHSASYRNAVAAALSQHASQMSAVRYLYDFTYDLKLSTLLNHYFALSIAAGSVIAQVSFKRPPAAVLTKCLKLNSIIMSIL